MVENEQDIQVKTAVELAEEKPVETVSADKVPINKVVLPLNKYTLKPIFPDRWTKKQMCRTAMHAKQSIAPFADSDCQCCHGSGIMATYKMGGQQVRKVCNCIHKVLTYIG